MHILAVDIGTTAMKMGVFKAEEDSSKDSLELRRQFSKEYQINTYRDGLFSDIEPEKWQKAFLDGCTDLEDLLVHVDAVALSGTTPGFTVMDKAGNPLNPAILMLDQRSRLQAREIIEAVVVVNTDMHHLFLGLPVAQLAVSPFVPAVGKALDVKARDLGMRIAPGAYVHLPPNIAGFVGSDHVSWFAPDWLRVDR